MTNAEKFKEVFGFDALQEYECVASFSYICKQYTDCNECDWWNQEYKPPCCMNCKHHHFEDVDRGWVCCNADSEKCADWTEDSDSCKCWEER